MGGRLGPCTLVAAGLALGGARGTSAQAILPDGFADQLVVSGLSNPTGIAFLPDGRLLFVERTSARIRLVVNDALAAIDPVATVPAVRTGIDRGVLGIAVDPGFPARPYLYVHYNYSLALTIRISRFTVGGDLSFTGNGNLTISPATPYGIITNAPDSSEFHNGGTLRFGPDGMLYASLGEDEAGCVAQDTSGLRGVLLRMDVAGLPSGPGGPPERELITPPGNPFPNGGLNARLIWAFGLRNPFRFHIDPLNGALFIADVGAGRWEEVDRAPVGGLDFGWSRYEGPDILFPCVLTLPHTPPVHYYAHAPGGVSIMSAGLYRAPPGASRPFPGDYDGDYFFSDYFKGFLRRLKGSGTSWSVAPPAPGQVNPSSWATGLQNVTDYAIAPDGSLWYCRAVAAPNGQIRRIVRTGTVAVAGPAHAAGSRFTTYPSPTSGTTHLSYTPSEPAKVTLVILDLGGRVVRHLAGPETAEAQEYDRVWDGRDDRGRALPAGAYRAVLTVGRERVERRLALVR